MMKLVAFFICITGFVGIDAWRTGEGWDALWARRGEFMSALDALIPEYGTEITYDCSMMHHNGNEVDTENHYLAGRFFKRKRLCRKGMIIMMYQPREQLMQSAPQTQGFGSHRRKRKYIFFVVHRHRKGHCKGWFS